jgi:hypothetical protein
MGHFDHFVIFLHDFLPIVLTFRHRLKQIGFLRRLCIVDPDLDLRQIHLY